MKGLCECKNKAIFQILFFLHRNEYLILCVVLHAFVSHQCASFHQRYA